MSGLGPKDQELLAAARKGWRPPAGAEDRVLASVLARVGPPPGGGGQAAPAPTTAPAASTAKLAIVKVGVAAIALGGAALLLARLAEPVSPAAAIATATAIAPIATAMATASAPAAPFRATEAPPSEASSAATAPIAPVAPSQPTARAVASAVAAPSAAPAASTDADAMRREAELMRRAQEAIRDGDAKRALEALDEHAKEHAGGVLAEERQAARVRALCLQGRTDEARAALAELRRIAPQSPQLAHLRGSCADK